MTTATRLRDQLGSEYRRAQRSLVLRGLLSLAVAVLILWRPLESTAALALLIGVWASVEGIEEIVRAFDLRNVFAQWWVLLLGGIVSVGFSIAAFYYYPAVSLTFIVLLVVSWLVFSGALAIYVALQERQLALRGWGWTLTFGIVSILAGAAAAMYPAGTVVAFLGILSGVSFVRGVVLLYAASRLASAKDELTATFRPASPA